MTDAHKACWKALGLVDLAYAELGILTSKLYSNAEKKAAIRDISKRLRKASKLLGKVKIPRTHE